MTLARLNDSVFPTFLDRIFDDRKWLGTTENDLIANSFAPAVNIKETESGFSVELAAPGMKKEDFKLSIEHDRLSISAEAKTEKKEDDDSYSCREFSYHSFQRSFSLPENAVDQDKISAQYRDGILYVELPKRDEIKTKPARTIDIK